MRQPQSNGQTDIKVIRALFLINAFIWISLGVTHIVQSRTQTTLIVVVLLFINAIIFLWLSRSIGKRLKWIYYFAVVLIVANLILTITDQFGLFDLFVLVLDGMILALLVFRYRRLLPSSAEPGNPPKAE